MLALKNNISQLSDNELKEILAIINKEQSDRKNKRRIELANLAITALKNLQNEWFGDCITIACDECGCAMCLTFDEIAEKIKDEIILN